MRIHRKHVAALAVAATVAAAGTGAALAHDGPGKGRAGVKEAVQHRAGHGLFGAAADYLGLTPQALREQLRAGKSLAQIATGQGKSADGLEQAILANVKTRLDKAVAAGRISAEQEQAFLDRLESRLDTLVNRTLHAGWRTGG
jgi:ribosomal protein S4